MAARRLFAARRRHDEPELQSADKAGIHELHVEGLRIILSASAKTRGLSSISGFDRKFASEVLKRVEIVFADEICHCDGPSIHAGRISVRRTRCPDACDRASGRKDEHGVRGDRVDMPSRSYRRR